MFRRQRKIVSVWSGEQPPTVVEHVIRTETYEGVYHVHTPTEVFRFPLSRILLVSETKVAK
jgi:hypothetical protein